MNRNELRDILQAERIRQDAYDLHGGHPSELYVLSGPGPIWSVYYCERGIETGLQQFGSEEAACEYLLKVLLEDPTTKMTTWSRTGNRPVERPSRVPLDETPR
jgi:hypothetical protein